MQLRQINTPEKWTEFWLEKFSLELEKRKYPFKEVAAQKSIIKLFLSRNTGNPRTIDLKKMSYFVATHKTTAIAPLMLFYEAISHSEKHLEALAALESRKITPQKKKRKILEQSQNQDKT